MKMVAQKNDVICELLARCSAGDQCAFTRLYSLMNNELRSYAYRYLHCEELCKETIQESMLQVWKNASVFDAEKGKAATWMYSIVKYRALDKLKAENKHLFYCSIDDMKVEPDSLCSSHQPEQESIVLQNLHGLQKSFNQLKENEKTCVSLAHIDGYSRTEIASLLNTNVNTVKSWVRRGLQHFRKDDWQGSGAL